MIFSENRFPLFRIMLVAPPFTLNTGKGRKDCPTMANVAAAKGGEIEVKVQM
jgi:hypothetical protein